MAIVLFIVACDSVTAGGAPLFTDDFEKYTAGQEPGAPWKDETYNSGAVIRVDAVHAFSGKQSIHILTPAGAKYRRGYMAIHLRAPLPGLILAMYGRAMIWLEAAPIALPGAPPVHWTLLQGEGRSADDRYNSIYRLGVEGAAGTQLMANFETTPPVTTDCRQKSALALPVGRWVCIEWHFVAAKSELRFWRDGRGIAHIIQRSSKNSCRGNDLAGEWRAPPAFDSLYVGFERYADSANDQNLWIDDVVLSGERVGCPAAAK